MYRDLCPVVDGIHIIWDNLEPFDNIYEFTDEELDVLSQFVHIIRFPSVAVQFAFLHETYFQVFGRILYSDKFDSLIHEETLVVGDAATIPMLYNPRIMLSHGVRAIVTDKGSLVYCDYTDCKLSRLRVGDFCKHILAGCFYSGNSKTMVSIDDRIESLYEDYKFGEADDCPMTVDISDVTRFDLQFFLKHQKEGYTVYQNGAVYKYV